MGIEILKENTKAFREKKKMAAMENNKASSVSQMINGAIRGGGAAAAAASGDTTSGGQGTQIGGGGNERGFKCSSCKRTLMYEGRYQCMVCADISICKLCFGVKYHEQHEFLTRPQPDKDWEPAHRTNPTHQNEEYKKIMAEL